MIRKVLFSLLLLMGILHQSSLFANESGFVRIEFLRSLNTNDDIILCDQNANIVLDKVDLISSEGNIYLLGNNVVVKNGAYLSAKRIYVVSVDGTRPFEAIDCCVSVIGAIQMDFLSVEEFLLISPKMDLAEDKLPSLMFEKNISPNLDEIIKVVQH